MSRMRSTPPTLSKERFQRICKNQSLWQARTGLEWAINGSVISTLSCWDVRDLIGARCRSEDGIAKRTIKTTAMFVFSASYVLLLLHQTIRVSPSRLGLYMMRRLGLVMEIQSDGFARSLGGL